MIAKLVNNFKGFQLWHYLISFSFKWTSQGSECIQHLSENQSHTSNCKV